VRAAARKNARTEDGVVFPLVPGIARVHWTRARDEAG